MLSTDNNEFYYSNSGKLSKVDGEYIIAATQIHHTVMGRHSIVRETTKEILDNTKKIREAVDKSEDKADEEHRVWYVGVTRTKRNLYIMGAKQEDKSYDIENLG